MASAEFKQQAARFRQALAKKYEGKEKSIVAGPVGDGKVYASGQLFDGSLTGVTRVVNEGRLAAASYVAKNGGGGGAVISTGGGTTSTGGTGDGGGLYLPLNGSIAMSGNLNMGNNAIINVSTVDGRDLQADGVILDGIKNASIITMSADANLINERVLTVSPALSLADGGAGGNAVLGMTTPATVTVNSINDSTSGGHSHAVASSSNPGAQAMILATHTDGSIIVTSLGATTKVRTPLLDTASGNMTIQPNGSLLVRAGAGISPIVFSPALTDPVNFPTLYETRIGSDDYASKTTGWAIDHRGDADFRYVYTDELHAKVFIADLEQALAGGQIICKSVTLTYLDFVAPAAGATAQLTVRDLPSATGMAVFQNGDMIRLRNFSRTAGSLSISDCWGTVVLNTAYGTGGFDSSTKSQRYTFTRSSGGFAGAMTAGTVIAAESIALDYGTSGNGFYEVSATDGVYANKAPYSQIVTWTVHPASDAPGTGLDVKVRLGNLNGLTDPNLTPSGYGLYSDNVFLTGAISAANGEVLIDSDGVRVRATELVDFDGLNAYRIEAFDGTTMGGLYGRHYAGAYTVNVHSFGTSTINAYTEIRSTAGTGKWANVYLYASNLSQSRDASVLAFADDTQSYIRIDASEDDGHIELRSPVYAYFDFLPYLGGDKNLGSAAWEWDTLYVKQIVVSGAISGDTMSGQEWEYPGSMTIDGNSASDTTVSVINSGAGAVIFNVTGTIQQSGTAVSLVGHTHSTYLLKAGDTITGNISVSSGVTIDGVDISAHATDVNAHHARAHSLTSSSDHTATGAQWQILGLTATNTIGLLDSSDNPGATAKILRSTAAGILTLAGLTTSQITSTATLTLTPFGANPVDVQGRITGGFGATNVTGVVDWDDVSNSKSGSGFTLLQGIATNGPTGAGSNYFHAFNFEFGTSKTGIGNITQLAIPYGNTSIGAGMHMRGRYAGAWTAWARIVSENSNGNVIIGSYADMVGYKLGVAGSMRATANIAADVYVLGAGVGAGVANPEGVQSNASITETTRSAGNVRLGVIGGNPRIILDNGTTETSWQIDNFTSAFRIFRSGNVALTIDANNYTRFYGNIGDPYYVSQATGWRIDALGGADFRYVYTTELHAKTFIADLEQALAGSQIITKSVSTVTNAYGNFIVPYPGGSAFLDVDDLPSAENMSVFESSDFVRLRQMSRAGGGLYISDLWGTVSYVGNLGNKMQRWTFTRSAGATTYNTSSYTAAPVSTTTSGATSRSATKPTGTLSGHYLLAFVQIAAETATITPPAGWTELATGAVTGTKATLYYKVAGGAEPSSYTWTFSTSTAASVTIANYSNVQGIMLGGVNEQSTAITANAAPASTYRSPKDTFIVFSGLAGNVRVTPSAGLTELIDAGTGSIGSYMAHQTGVGPGVRSAVGGTAASAVRSVSISVHLIPTYLSGSLDSYTGFAAPGTGIADGTLVLDYGISGSGYVETTAIDGIYGSNSPYQRIATWSVHPSQITVRTQTGNLYGLFGQPNEYGFYAGNGTTVNNSYVRLSSYTAVFNNVPINVHQVGIKRMEIIPAGGLNFRVDSSANTVDSQMIGWYSNLDAKTTPNAYLVTYAISGTNSMELRINNGVSPGAELNIVVGTGAQLWMGGSSNPGRIWINAADSILVSAPNGVNFNGADLLGVDHITALSGLFSSSFAVDGVLKATRVHGAGYDGTRYYAAGIGLNLAWNGTGYRFGTDGGSNGGVLLLAEGSGEHLMIYTRPADGAYSSTLSPAALTSLKRMTINDTGVIINQRLAVGGTGYSSGLVVVESNAVYSGITAVLTTSGGSPGSVIRAFGAGLAPTLYDFYRWYSAYGPTEGGIRAHTFAGSWGTTIWSDNTIALRAGGYADNVAAGLVILTSGNTGIGVAVPSYKLDVSGAAHASSFPTSSDARFKEDLMPLTAMLDKVGKLGTYNFYWRKNYAAYDQFLDADGKPIKQIGFVAQEVEQLFPELISRWSHTGIDGVVTDDAYSVDYARMVTVLVQAIRELRTEKDKQIKDLRAEMRAMKEEKS